MGLKHVHLCPVDIPVVVRVENVQRVHREPLVVVLELEQLRNRTVIVDVVFVLEDDRTFEELGDGSKLIIPDENVGSSRVKERHVAPALVEDYICAW